MRRLTDQQVDRIAQELAGRLGAGTPSATSPAQTGYTAPMGVLAAPAAMVDPALMSRHGEGDGVFNTIDNGIEAARTAFTSLNAATLAKRTEIIAAIRETMLREGDDLARQAWQETGLGRYEDKVIKNRLVTEKTPGTEALRPETTTGDNGLTLMEWAPFGVIGAITPTTNPTSTIICNSIGMLAAGNSVVFNVHPGAAACSMATVRLLNRAIVSVGGPANLVTAIAQPTIESATELMHHKGINLLVVTGGPGVVKAAMKSGKRSVSAGPGNPPAVVDETADLAKAGRDIVTGASFDNNVICVDEKQVFVVASVADELLKQMGANGAYLVDQSELRRLEKVIFDEFPGPRTHGTINKKWVGKNADVILAEIGVRVGPEVRLVIADVPEDHPLVWSEQLMPVLPVVRVSDVNRAIDLARESEHGFGHSASMHSRNIENLSRMARTINTSI
ncbi:MAG: aldehyde dehydrogenase, partial [Candidatus Krumholzibacteria bacterium]|nr:aldehyde dehydrogenase [Candidatus Krumholzibacteria bacterium]